MGLSIDTRLRRAYVSFAKMKSHLEILFGIAANSVNHFESPV
jgi:hypothetical protein